MQYDWRALPERFTASNELQEDQDDDQGGNSSGIHRCRWPQGPLP